MDIVGIHYYTHAAPVKKMARLFLFRMKRDITRFLKKSETTKHVVLDFLGNADGTALPEPLLLLKAFIKMDF
jgi:hypothetical protein